MGPHWLPELQSPHSHLHRAGGSLFPRGRWFHQHPAFGTSRFQRTLHPRISPVTVSPDPNSAAVATTALRPDGTTPSRPLPGTRTPNVLADRTSRSPSRSAHTSDPPLRSASPASPADRAPRTGSPAPPG